ARAGDAGAVAARIGIGMAVALAPRAGLALFSAPLIGVALLAVVPRGRALDDGAVEVAAADQTIAVAGRVVPYTLLDVAGAEAIEIQEVAERGLARVLDGVLAVAGQHERELDRGRDVVVAELQIDRHGLSIHDQLDVSGGRQLHALTLEL